MKKIKILSGLLLLAVLLACFCFQFYERKEIQSAGTAVFLGGQKIKLELADTEKKREQGLSGRKSMCLDCGMLFVFERKGKYSFWMKNMNFSLDMLWLNGSKIVQIDERVPYAAGATEVRESSFSIDKVIEINAGRSEELGLKVGDEIGLFDPKI